MRSAKKFFWNVERHQSSCRSIGTEALRGRACNEYVRVKTQVVGSLVFASAGTVMLMTSCDETNGDTKARMNRESGMIHLKKRGDALSGNTCRDTTFYRDAKNGSILDLSSEEFTRIEIVEAEVEGSAKIPIASRKGLDYDAIAKCGCSVRMEELTDFCLKRGYVPQVTPEFRKITVGGAINGGGVESSSGKFGEFAETCKSVVLKLADGRVVSVENPSDSHDDGANYNRAELFDALSGSYGSLATVLHAEVKLVKAEKHVKLAYRWFRECDHNQASSGTTQSKSLHASSIALSRFCQRHDFAEALSFADNSHCIITADFIHVPDDCKNIQSLCARSDPWFYERVKDTEQRIVSAQESMISQSSQHHSYGLFAHEEIVSTAEYLHRHERGSFWMARPEGDFSNSMDLLKKGRIFGCLLEIVSRRGSQGNLTSRSSIRNWTFFDEQFKTEHLFRLFRSTPQAIGADNFLVTDIYTEVGTVSELVSTCRRWEKSARSDFHLATPIWLCPMRVPDRPQPFAAHGHKFKLRNRERFSSTEDNILIDVGLYGRVLPRDEGTESLGSANIAAKAAGFYEQWGLLNDARKMLYSQNFYSNENDFWYDGDEAGDEVQRYGNVRFNRTIYKSLREKYGADGRLADLYFKVGDCSARVEASRKGLKYWIWNTIAKFT